MRSDLAAAYLQHLEHHLRLVHANTLSLCRSGSTAAEREFLCTVRNDLIQREQAVQNYLATLLEDPADRHREKLFQTMYDLARHLTPQQ